jgi:DNA repair exonuclease SbcCD ATPase subunit
MYNEEQLKADIEALKQVNEELKEEIEKKESVISECDKDIKTENEKRDILLSSKLPIDDKIINVDVTTLNESIKRIIESGKKKNSDLEYFKKEVESIGEVTYSDDDYRAYKKKNEELIDKMAEARTLIKNLIQTNKNLESAESCPLCHRKFDNIDNSETINKNKKEIDSLTKSGISMKATSDDLVKKMAAIDDKRAISQKKSQLELKIATINSDLASQRLDYKEKKQLLDEINKNKEAISKNSEIDAKINVINANIKAKDDIKRTANSDIVSLKRDIDKNTNEASLKSGYIVKIEEERKIEKYWKLYLQMIGKDGIGKMVLRNTLPIINGELDNLLSDVCDFTVEIVMNDKNDIDFILHRDGISTNLSAASGLEKTQASLALRVVLGELSKLSRPPFILLDEVLGTVARENYDSMEKLYRKISKNYDFILHITHINDIVDWHDGGIITVVKENNISTIKNN